MAIINDEQTYNAKLAEFEELYKSTTVPLEEKIKFAEELVYCDFARTPGHKRIGGVTELADLYKKCGCYRKHIDFIVEDIKENFEDGKEYAMFFVLLAPFVWLDMIDSHIILGNYESAKNGLEVMVSNARECLQTNPDGPFAGSHWAWLKRCMAEYARIAILEKNYARAAEILTDSMFNDNTCIGKFFYCGILLYESPTHKDIKSSIGIFEQLSVLERGDSFTELEEQMIVKSNYYLGLIYSTENGFKNKEKAIAAFNRAKQLGYDITDEEIKSKTGNIVDDKEAPPAAPAAATTGEKKKGCYVATCVYGSYDCPEVWTLRRFRDTILSKHLLGRLFILIYYTFSPTIVKYFGNCKWFGKLWKKPLDKVVKKLVENGTENTPYTDL